MWSLARLIGKYDFFITRRIIDGLRIWFHRDILLPASVGCILFTMKNDRQPSKDFVIFPLRNDFEDASQNISDAQQLLRDSVTASKKENLPNSLRFIRKKTCDLTQEQFLQKFNLEISRNYLSELESGKKKPSFEVLIELSSKVGLPIAFWDND